MSKKFNLAIILIKRAKFSLNLSLNLSLTHHWLITELHWTSLNFTEFHWNSIQQKFQWFESFSESFSDSVVHGTKIKIRVQYKKRRKLDHDENGFPSFSITTRPKSMIFCTKSISFRFRRPWWNVGNGTINTADLKSTKSVSSPSLKIKMYVVIFP